jgi:hypothetical protein
VDATKESCHDVSREVVEYKEQACVKLEDNNLENDWKLLEVLVVNFCQNDEGVVYYDEVKEVKEEGVLVFHFLLGVHLLY